MAGEIDSALDQYSEIHSDLIEAYEVIEGYARQNSYFWFEELSSELRNEASLSEADKIVEFLEEAKIIEQLHPEMEGREYSGVAFKYGKFESIVNQLNP